MDNLFIKYLKTLQLDINADKRAIKSAYRRLVKIHHPDLFTNPENKEKAANNFKKITKAYEYLMNNYIPPEQRVYNRSSQKEYGYNNYDYDKDITKILNNFIKNETMLKIYYYNNYGYKNSYDIIIIPLEILTTRLIAYSVLEKRERIFNIDQIDSVEVYNGNLKEYKQSAKKNYSNKYYEQYDTYSNAGNYESIPAFVSNYISKYFHILVIAWIVFCFLEKLFR